MLQKLPERTKNTLTYFFLPKYVKTDQKEQESVIKQPKVTENDEKYQKRQKVTKNTEMCQEVPDSVRKSHKSTKSNGIT
ncbi:MAG TPA: hypothetical protein VGD22_04700 [Sphingobacteriaceae bacterium]